MPTYDIRYSSAADDRFIDDFTSVERQVFGNGYDRDLFRHKFLDNPYGQSVLAVVYIDGQPSAARALWRNDVDGHEAYQPGDTCVLAPCRGKGVFSEMTRRAVAMLPPTALIYNFPNTNSYPGYLKLGWTLQKEGHLVLLTSNRRYLEENPLPIDAEYASWWLPTDKVRRIRRGSTYYLVVKFPRPMTYKILGRTDRETALRYPALRRLALIFYPSRRTTWYNRRFLPLHVVTNNNPAAIDIPVWKIDAI